MITKIYLWAKDDYHDHPARFILEIVAWITSIGCSLTMALTLPNPPFLILYPLFISQCAFFAWCAWSRNSLGMLANYGLLVTIDSIGLIRLIINT